MKSRPASSSGKESFSAVRVRVEPSILDFIREDLLAHFSFPFWLHIMIGQLTGCSKKRAKADWLMTCAKADWLRTNVVTFFLLSDWLIQNLPLF